MLGRLTRCIELSIIIALSAGLHAQTSVNSIRNRLAKADNMADSIVLLYNIYDASPVSQQGRVLDEIYNAAISHKDFLTATKVLRHSADYYSNNDSMLSVLVSRAEKLPDNNDKRSTTTFLNIMLTLNKVKSQSKSQREEMLRDLLSRHSESMELEIYKRIEYLCRLCIYLRTSTNGDLLTNYQRELQTLIDNLPPYDLALRYIFYVHAAETYLSAVMIPEGVEANRKLLEVVDGLKKQCAASGHTSPDYDHTTFMCYSRLLRCFDSLTAAEVDEFHSRIESLSKHLPDSVLTAVQRKAPQVYYMMAKKRYADAIPMIKELIANSETDNDERLYLLRDLITATEATADREALQEALEMSNDMLRTRLENKAASSYKDLQMIYEVNDLKTTNNNLKLTNQQIEIDRHKEQLAYALTCLAVLTTILLIVYFLYRRSKKLTSNLTKSNKLITNERDAIQHAQKDLLDASNKAKKARLMKEDFINSMGNEIRTPLEFIVEYSNLIANFTDDKSRREYIQRFANIITLNADLLLTLVNNVLNLPLLENVKRCVHKVRTSALGICMEAVSVAEHYVKPGVHLVFDNENSADIPLETDPDRVQQILVNLLTNAAKFTEQGTITLKYTLSPHRDKIMFTVTDTGIGIPSDMADSIFCRNVNHDLNKGGLYISRLLAKIMDGDLFLDKNYHSGAKFVLSIPAL